MLTTTLEPLRLALRAILYFAYVQSVEVVLS